MADHTDNNLRAIVKALSDVVEPALDPDNPLAREQLALVIAWIEFYRTRLPYLGAREHLELDVQMETGRALLEAVPPPVQGDLTAALAQATSLRGETRASSPQLRQATSRIEDEISALVRRSADLAPDTRRRVEKIVLDHTRDFLDAQRAWFLPHSVEPDPAAVPSLPAALRIVER